MEDKTGTATPVFFDASGRQVKDRAAHLAARVPAGVRTATACLAIT